MEKLLKTIKKDDSLSFNLFTYYHSHSSSSQTYWVIKKLDGFYLKEEVISSVTFKRISWNLYKMSENDFEKLKKALIKKDITYPFPFPIRQISSFFHTITFNRFGRKMSKGRYYLTLSLNQYNERRFNYKFDKIPPIISTIKTSHNNL